MSCRIVTGPAECQDAAAIVDIIREGFDPNIVDMFIYGCPGIPDYIAAQIEAGPLCDTRYTVARVQGRIVGVVEFRILPRTLFLNYIAVERAVRAHGLGRQLLLAATRSCVRPSQTEMALDVLEHNRIAQAWYERIGFTSCATTEWWVLPSQEGVPVSPSGPLLRQAAAASASQRAYGFSTFVLDLGDHEVTIGRMGSSWFRITDAGALTADVLSLLHEFDPGRSVLALLPSGCADPAKLGGRVVAKTIRMTTELAPLLARLECKDSEAL